MPYGAPGGPVGPGSPWGGPAAPGAWAPPAQSGFALGRSPQADRAPAWMLGLAAFVIVLLIAGAGFVVTSESGPDYPDEWDARVAPLAEFVAEERGLEFEHPVTVNFLTAEEYSAETRSDTGNSPGPTEEEKAEMEEYVAVMRALGLVSGTFDVEAATNQIADSGTLAFYSPVEKQVYVRGTELTPALRVTLVHELTHVLQDQHFDLEQLGTAEGPVATTVRALAEGDAGRVEEVYAAEVLTDEERKAYEKKQQEDSDGAEDDLADVPEILTATFGAPYAFGPAVVQIAFAMDGNTGVDALFEAPPSEFALFDPIGFPPAEHTAADQERIDIELPEGAEQIDEDTFGPVFWYLLLSARLGDEAAFDAVEGVSADGFLSYRQDGKVCVKGSARAEKADADELRSALESWAEQGPKGSAEVAGSGDQVDLTSCDPGKDAESAGEVTEDALILPVRRNYTFAQIIDNGRSEGADAEQAECYALGIFDLLTTEEIVDPSWTPSKDQERELLEIGTSCR
jgi:hypothetical protein